jgi:hypothetical protein
MPDEDTPEMRSYDEMERDLLYHLTTPEDGQPLWSVEDLNREMERRDAIDLVRGLHRAGLVNKTTDGFVFATRAAVRVVQMVGHVV